MSVQEVPFEQPLEEIRRRIEELESYPEESGHGKEIVRLRRDLEKATAKVYSGLSRWEKTLAARHPQRPYTLDYVALLTENWVELHGDRAFADDAAIVGGLATFRGRSVMILGHQKGRGTKSRIHRNFGQPRPEGYRKALRLMKLAERFRLPILIFIDTPGAYPGIGAEERGQAEAIARNLIEMSQLTVPVVVTVTGEGGSGGALALGVGDRVFMLEYSIYSVISPEGCAAILWQDQQKKEEAAEAMKLTAPDLLELGVVDQIIQEPTGGAQADPVEAARRIADAAEAALDELSKLSSAELLEARYRRFRSLGVFLEAGRARR